MMHDYVECFIVYPRCLKQVLRVAQRSGMMAAQTRALNMFALPNVAVMTRPEVEAQLASFRVRNSALEADESPINGPNMTKPET